MRIGIDRDEDGVLDGDEEDAGSDPADAASTIRAGQWSRDVDVLSGAGALSRPGVRGNPHPGVFDLMNVLLIPRRSS